MVGVGCKRRKQTKEIMAKDSPYGVVESMLPLGSGERSNRSAAIMGCSQAVRHRTLTPTSVVRLHPPQSRCVAQFGRALHLGCRGRRSESCRIDADNRVRRHNHFTEKEVIIPT